MKKINVFAYVCAIAIVGTCMTSCQKDEPTNGRQQKQEEVKTEFSIALPQQLTGKRRMPATTTQATGASSFQGIADGIVLVPFAKQAAIIGTDTRLGDNIILSDGLDVTSLTAGTNAKVYSDVSIPLSTGSFLFYAKSAAANTSVAQKFEAGSLIANYENAKTTPANFLFELEPINPTPADMFGTTAAGYKLLQYLTSVATASYEDGSTIHWYDVTAEANPAMKAMFDTYTSMHGLSSFEVARVLQDLYSSLKPQSSDLAVAIKAAINNATYIDADELADNDSVALVSDLLDFPQSYNLPEGSIDIAWNASTHVFEEGAYSNMTNPARFVYPAQLWYFANSPIKTSNQSKKTLFEDTSKDWDQVLSIIEGEGAATAVNTRTRAVAVVNPIEYAVGRFDVQVKLAGATLADNSETVEGVATPVTCPGFPVTAILIGGQKNVGFDFTPGTSPEASPVEYTIYDRVMASTAAETPSDMIASTSYSAMNHTLVLETAESTTTKVRIAVEMLNNTGKDFYGFGGQLVPKNGKFYVCAELEAATKEADETVAGQVFKQDYVTTARLNLKDLKKAYNTIPDLRTPELELGFSVNLEWQSGRTYEIDFE